MEKVLTIAFMGLIIYLVFGSDIIEITSGRTLSGILTAITLGVALLLLFGGANTFWGELAFIIGLIVGFILGYFSLVSALINSIWTLIKWLCHQVWRFIRWVVRTTPWWAKLLIVIVIFSFIIVIT